MAPESPEDQDGPPPPQPPPPPPPPDPKATSGDSPFGAKPDWEKFDRITEAENDE